MPTSKQRSGKRLAEHVQSGAGWHGGVDRDDLVVALRLFDQFAGEHLGIAGGVGGGRLGLLAGDDVELGHRVVLVGRAFGRAVALALLSDHVNQHRLVVHMLDVIEHRHQVLEIVAVDRPDVIEAQFLEERAAGGHAPGVLLGLAGHVLQRARQMAGHLLAELSHALIGPPGHQAREIGAHAADRRGDRHVVVVEDHDQPAGRLGGVVHRLIGHAGAHRAVADHGDDAVVVAAHVARDAEAEGRRYRGGGVGRAERVVRTFRPLGEARQTAALAKGANPVAAAGQDLVGIGLMSDVPDQDIARRVEHVMQCDGEFDHAEPGAEVTAGLGDRVDGFGPQLVGQLAKVGKPEGARIRRSVDGVQQGGG